MLVRPAPRLSRRQRPLPFSSEWVATLAAATPERRGAAVPAWLPSERRLSALLVLLLAAGVALAG